MLAAWAPNCLPITPHPSRRIVALTGGEAVRDQHKERLLQGEVDRGQGSGQCQWRALGRHGQGRSHPRTGQTLDLVFGIKSLLSALCSLLSALCSPCYHNVTFLLQGTYTLVAVMWPTHSRMEHIYEENSCTQSRLAVATSSFFTRNKFVISPGLCFILSITNISLWVQV